MSVGVNQLEIIVKISVDDEGEGSAKVTNSDGEILTVIDSAAFGELTLEDILIDVVEGQGFDLNSNDNLDEILEAIDQELPPQEFLMSEETAEPTARLISVGNLVTDDDGDLFAVEKEI